jgi:hypothetical protein
MAAIDEFIENKGEDPIEQWESQNDTIANSWINRPDDSETALLRVIGETNNAMRLKGKWQNELRNQLRVQGQERQRTHTATQSNYYGPVHYGDTISGDKISIEHGDYVCGDKIINPLEPAPDT